MLSKGLKIGGTSMKTISDMQIMIKDAYSKLNELSSSLSEYVSLEDKDTVIDFEMLKTIGKRNPIDGHMLSKVDNLTKKQYITLLISLLYLSNVNQEKGWLFIQRIAIGAGIKNDLVDISADALTLTDKQLDSFSESIIFENLSSVFVLDCMLVYLVCENKNSQMLAFISQLIELVKINESEVREISKIAGYIATQNKEAYFNCCLNQMHIKLSESLCYMIPIKGTIVSNLDDAAMCDDEHVIIFNATISKLNHNINLDDIPAKTIEFFYCMFENTLGIKSEIKNVIFKNTTFSNIAPEIKSIESSVGMFGLWGRSKSKLTTNFSIIEIGNCELSFCEFTNCMASKHFILIGKGNINNCIFENCSALEVPSNKYLVELASGDIKNCKFEKCSIKTNYDDRKSTVNGIVKLEQGKIINSKFIECESYGDSFYSSFPIYESYILYLSNSHADMNEFNKCYCTSNDSSNKVCKHYIIAMQNSHQSKNVFSECSSYHYKYGQIGKNIAVGIIE